MINKETTIHQSLYDADVNIYLPTEAFNKEQNSYRVYKETWNHSNRKKTQLAHSGTKQWTKNIYVWKQPTYNSCTNYTNNVSRIKVSELLFYSCSIKKILEKISKSKHNHFGFMYSHRVVYKVLQYWSFELLYCQLYMLLQNELEERRKNIQACAF